MHVSVPGMKKKPSPYRLQTFTYSAGLALTGRSAACAPDTAIIPAAPPRRSVFTVFIIASNLCGGVPSPEVPPWSRRAPARPRQAHDARRGGDFPITRSRLFGRFSREVLKENLSQSGNRFV